MGSHLEALVASQARPDLDDVATRLVSRWHSLPQGLALLPLPEAVLSGGRQAGFGDFRELATDVAELARHASSRARIAYVESETFAGEGSQGAVVWQRGEVLWGPRFTCNVEDDARTPYVWAPGLVDGAINQALRELGVERGEAQDEFEALGLHLRRFTKDWLAES